MSDKTLRQVSARVVKDAGNAGVWVACNDKRFFVVLIQRKFHVSYSDDKNKGRTFCSEDFIRCREWIETVAKDWQAIQPDPRKHEHETDVFHCPHF